MHNDNNYYYYYYYCCDSVNTTKTITITTTIMDSEQQHQLQSLTDFWKEPWTASTWETWSNQNPAYQGLQPSSWMYTSERTMVEISQIYFIIYS